ncbi:hypothetical protein UlMin_021951 [Ulmus minor]
MTAVHVAAREGHSEFVEKIVKEMPAEALEIRDIHKATALHHVAVSGSLRTAKALIKKNPTLTNILDKTGHTPLLIAVALGCQHKDLVWYLSMVTKDEGPTRHFSGPLGGDLAITLSRVDFNDILLYLVDRYPSLATARGRGGISFLHMMTSRTSSFFSCSKFGLWESCIYKSPRFLERLQDAKLQHHCARELVKIFYSNKACLEHDSPMSSLIHQRVILCKAAEFGIVEIVRTCLRNQPEFAYGYLSEKQNLVSIAVEHRQEKIFTLFCERNQRNTQLFIGTTKAGTMLHLVAKLAPFRQLSSAVEKFMRPNVIDLPNDDGKIAREVFTEEHKALAEAGEKWMKDTSNSCMIVSTLIATFVFAAAFTVPGGNDGDGIPIFLWTKSFLVFVIADSLALFSSITSLLMFFSILTARYAEEDFLEQLPKKLIFGLAALFFSIATMMMAFGATLYIVLSKRLNWVTIPIILLASFPVTIFALLQFPLFFQMFRSTFRNNIFRPQSPWR